MKVLWIKSDFPLPADTGGKIRTMTSAVRVGEAVRRNVSVVCAAGSR